MIINSVQLDGGQDPVRSQMPSSLSGLSRGKLLFRIVLLLLFTAAIVALYVARENCLEKRGSDFILVPPVGCEQLDD